MSERAEDSDVEEEDQRNIDDKFEAYVAEEILHWIADVVGEDINTSGNVENFVAVLRDGTILCKLANELEPGAVDNFNTSSLDSKQIENILIFLTFAGRYVSPKELFQTVDLYEARDPNAVLVCLSALSQKTERPFSRPGVDPRMTPKLTCQQLPYDILFTVVEKWMSNGDKFFSLMLINRELAALFKRLLRRKAETNMTVENGELQYICLDCDGRSNLISTSEYIYLCPGMNVINIAFFVSPEDVGGGEFEFLPGRAAANTTVVHFHFFFESSPFFAFNFELFRMKRWRKILTYTVRSCVNLRVVTIELGNVVMNTSQVLDFVSSLQFLIVYLINDVLPFINVDRTCMALSIQFAISNAIYRLFLSERRTDLNCRVFAQAEIAIFFQLMTIIVLWSLQEILPRLRLSCIVNITFTHLPAQHNFVELLENFRQSTGLITSKELTAAENVMTTTTDNGNTDHYFAIHWKFPISSP